MIQGYKEIHETLDKYLALIYTLRIVYKFMFDLKESKNTSRSKYAIGIRS